MSRPNLDQFDRDAIDDLGLVPDSDHTEVLTKRKAPVAAEALRNEQTPPRK